MSNQAAWLSAKGAPLNVETAPYPQPEADQVIIRNRAVGLNPVDWKVQEYGFFVPSWPTILGCDLAGEVVEAGEGVTQFHKGQRVLAHAVALAGPSRHAAFQLYSIEPAQLLTPIPDDISFEDASVIPLALSTAALGMYAKDLLALPYPTPTAPKPTGSTLLIWGGSSSVGSTAIQLAISSGLKVVSTASPHNFEYVKSLGAEAVFDHSSPSIVDDLLHALKGSKLAGGYDSIGLPESGTPLAEVVGKLGGGLIITVLNPPEHLPPGVEVKSVSAIQMKDSEVAKAIYGEYLPQALKDGSFKPRPKATVVGEGLESVQAGLDRLKKGVSATKLVVSLP